MTKLMKNEIRFRNWFFVICLCGYLFSPAAAFANKKIFILHSYHQEYPWTYNENKGFTETLMDDDSVENIAFSTEYLDTKRVKFSKEYQIFFFKYLKQKYALYSPDVIFCSDDNALTFLLQFKERLFGDTPVIFCGVNNLDIEEELKSNQYLGIFEKKEISPNLTFLKKITSQPGKIIFLGDNSSTHQAIEQQIRVDMTSHFPNQQYIILSNNNLPHVITQLKTLKEGVIFLTTIGGLKDGNDAAMTLKESIASIVSAGNFTIISMEDVYLKKGVLGGYVTSGFSQGEAAAHFAIQILKGNSLSSISLAPGSTNEYMFNYPQLKRLGINTSNLPPNSIILNRPLSIYDHYKHEIWATVLFVSLQTLIIVALVKNIHKRKCAERSLLESRDELEEKVLERTSELTNTNANLEKEIIERKQIEGELKESEERFKALHDASFGGIIIHEKGIILDCNQGLSDITGFSNEELVGMNGLKLIAPDWLDQVLENIKNGYSKAYEVEGLRKNGSVYPLAIRGKNIPYKGRDVRVIEFRDITDLKRAEEEIKSLRDILPICSFCKNIRNDEGYYEKLEEYIHKHSGVDFSHTICPACMKEHYPEEYESLVNEKGE